MKIIKKHILFHYLLTKNTSVYFDSFGIDYICLEVLSKIKGKSNTQKIYRMEDNELIMCEFYCITVIEYMLAGKTLLKHTNSIPLKDYKK